MFPHEQPYLHRNVAMRLGYCADGLEIVDLGEHTWDDPDEEKAAKEIRKLCDRYIAAYDYHYGAKDNGD